MLQKIVVKFGVHNATNAIWLFLSPVMFFTCETGFLFYLFTCFFFLEIGLLNIVAVVVYFLLRRTFPPFKYYFSFYFLYRISSNFHY